MRIAIIGGTGNAGRALCAQAVSRGHQVTAMVRNPGRDISVADTPPGPAPGRSSVSSQASPAYIPVADTVVHRLAPWRSRSW
jgi:uncharacterized protein